MGVAPSSTRDSRIRLGHRVLEVTPGSPGAEANLVSYIDIIVAINDTTLDNDDFSLVKLVVANVNKPTKFTVYDSKVRALREEVVTPRRGWGGAGILGLVARYDSFSLDVDHILAVTDVIERSPAKDAGIRAHEDIILGSEKQTFRDASKFVDCLLKHDGQILVLYVYNPPSDTIRPVAIVPNRTWAGAQHIRRQGANWPLIGCGVALVQYPTTKRAVSVRNADLERDADLFGPVSLGRLQKLGNLMSRTLSKTKAPSFDPSIPLPPPPPPPLPPPPTHEDNELSDDEGAGGAAAAAVSPPPDGSDSRSSSGSSRSTGSSDSRSRSGSGSSVGSDEGKEGGTDEPPGPLRKAVPMHKRPVMTSAEMETAITRGAYRTKGLGTHRLTRGASRKMSLAAAKRAALAAQGRLQADGSVAETAPGAPVELMLRTKEQRQKEEEMQKRHFALRNPLLI